LQRIGYVILQGSSCSRLQWHQCIHNVGWHSL